MRVVRTIILTLMALWLGACASVYNLPLNKPSATPFMPVLQPSGQRGEGTSTIVGLAFSGGGTRAAAFAHGVLGELARTPSPGRETGRDLIDHVGLVTGVSGGAVIAAYYGLKGRAALTDFRQRYLDQDLMAELRTSIDIANIGRALGGGVNDDSRMRDWLNTNLYQHATFGTLLARRRPVVLVNATDMYSRTPFVFEPGTFAAMCSDLTEYPIAAAVAASAAVPGAFAPVVLETFPGQCTAPLPAGMQRAARDPFTSPQLHAFARALERSRTGSVKYIKLLDGGLVDNYGLSSLTITRAVAGTPYGPLQPAEAVNLRRLLFLVVDAGVGPGGQWSQTLEGPAGGALVSAVVDVVVEANSQANFSAFDATMRNWRDQMVRWRCGLRGDDVARLRGRSGPWNCNDLKITIARISFGQLGPERAKILDAVPTSFSLPPDSVDALISGGADALAANPDFQAFLRDR